MKIASLPTAAIKNLRTLLRTEPNTPNQEILLGDEGDEPLVVITWGRYQELLRNTRFVPTWSQYTSTPSLTVPLPSVITPWTVSSGMNWKATDTGMSNMNGDGFLTTHTYKVE